jgi:hypothetical protein
MSLRHPVRPRLGAGLAGAALALVSGATAAAPHAAAPAPGKVLTVAAGSPYRPVTTVALHAGYNVIRLAKGAPHSSGGTGYAELDYVQLT